jgi:hypothetical protein
VVVVAEAGEGWPGRAERAAIPPPEADAPCLDFFFFFFFSCGFVVSHKLWSYRYRETDLLPGPNGSEAVEESNILEQVRVQP